MILLDTSAIVAAADDADPWAPRVRAAMEADRGPLVIPAPVTAEADYMLTARHGPGPALAFMEDLAAGRFLVECLLPHEYQLILSLSRRYAALAPGIADLSLVVLAARFDTTRLLTFRERHFRTIEPIQGGAFTLLPIDT